MKVALLKDVLISNAEVGTSGQVYDLPEAQARALVKRGLAKEVAKHPLQATADALGGTVRESKPAADRKTKPQPGPTETK